MFSFSKRYSIEVFENGKFSKVYGVDYPSLAYATKELEKARNTDTSGGVITYAISLTLEVILDI